MNRTRELIRQYEQAETEIRKEIEKEPEGNRGEYAKKLLASISAILAGLYVATETWSGNNVPRIYNEGVQQAQRGVNAQYKAAGMKPPDIGKMTSADFDAVSVLQRNLNTDLTNAVDHVGRVMEDEIRKAGLQASLEKVSSGRTVKQMQRSLVQMLEEKGIAAIEYMRGGKKCYMSLNAYAKLVARSTVHEARNTANINLGARIGNDLVKMSSHFGSCPICEPYQGRVFSVSGTSPNYPALYDTPWSSAYQNFHPHCFVSGTKVLARGVQAHSSRDYIGEIVTIRISGCDELTVTPNHPILTPKGWVAAGSLVKGDKVVKYIDSKSFIGRKNPNDIHIPTRIEDIPHTLRKSCGVSSITVETTAEQFHGDGIDGKVAIIDVYRLLRSKGDGTRDKKIFKLNLISRFKLGGFFNANSTGFEKFHGFFYSANTIVSVFSKFCALFRGHPCKTGTHSFGTVFSGHNTDCSKPLVDHHFGNTEVTSDIALCHTGFVKFLNFFRGCINRVTSLSGRCPLAQFAKSDVASTGSFGKSGLANADNVGALLDALSGKVEFLDIAHIEYSTSNLKMGGIWLMIL